MIHKDKELTTDDIVKENGIFVMECLICGNIIASANEMDMMPEIGNCWGVPTHEDWINYKKEKGLTNEDIAFAIGSTADIVKSMTQPNVPLPKWAIAMLYEWMR